MQAPARAPLLAAILLPPLLLWPLPKVATRALVSSPQSEGPMHIWGWWAAAHERAPFLGHVELLNFPDGLDLGLIDPLHTPIYLLGAALGGPALGFNLVLCLGLALGGLAAWALSRELDADGGGQLLATVAGVSTPGLLAVGVDGITEGLGAGWVVLQLALLLGLRRDPRPWRAAALGLAIAAGAAAGPYNAVFIAMIDIPLGIWMLRETRLHLAGGGLGALLGAAPLLAAARISSGQAGSAERAAPEAPSALEDWRGAWRDGADLLDLLLPAPLTGHVAAVPSTAYLGVVLLALGLLGAWRARRPWLLAAALTMAVIALGPWISVGGALWEPGGWRLRSLAGLFEALPVLERITRWYRAGAVAGLILAALASRALPRHAWIGAALVLLDARLLSPIPRSLPTIELPAPILTGIDGPFFQHPANHPHGRADSLADEGLLRQVSHGQATNSKVLSLEPTDPDPPRLLRQLLRGGPDAKAKAEALVKRLKRSGFRALVLYKQREYGPGRAVLDELLGAPAAEDEAVVAWRL